MLFYISIMLYLDAASMHNRQKFFLKLTKYDRQFTSWPNNNYDNQILKFHMQRAFRLNGLQICL